MRDDQIVCDWKGNEIKIGVTVIYGAPDEGKEDEAKCVVTEVTDADADYDDDAGRGVLYCPKVTVKFPDGETDTLSTYESGLNFIMHDEDKFTFACDDLEVVLDKM